VDAPHRLRPVAPGVNPRAKLLEVGLQILLVVRPRDPVDSRACLPLLTPERYCGGWTRDGRFIVKHKTQSNRLTRKLTALRQEAWRLMHRPLAEQHRWYASVLRGHYGYFGMPHNWRALNGILEQVRRIWFNCLRRRSQKNRRMPWAWFDDVISCLPLPRPRITHRWTPRAT
jgi:RNA-directed DNA polymerase